MLTKQILLGCLAILKLTFVDANMHGVDEFDMYDSNSMRRIITQMCGHLWRKEYNDCRALVVQMADDDDNFEDEVYYDERDYRFKCDSETCPNRQYSKRKFSQLDDYKCYANDYDNNYYSRRRRSIATGGWFWDWCVDVVTAAVSIVADGCVDEDGDLDLFSVSCFGDVALTIVPGVGQGAKVIKVGSNIAIKGLKTNKVVTINENKAKEIYKQGKKIYNF